MPFQSTYGLDDSPKYNPGNAFSDLVPEFFLASVNTQTVLHNSGITLALTTLPGYTSNGFSFAANQFTYSGLAGMFLIGWGINFHNGGPSSNTFRSLVGAFITASEASGDTVSSANSYSRIIRVLPGMNFLMTANANDLVNDLFIENGFFYAERLHS